MRHCVSMDREVKWIDVLPTYSYRLFIQTPQQAIARHPRRTKGITEDPMSGRGSDEQSSPSARRRYDTRPLRSIGALAIMTISLPLRGFTVLRILRSPLQKMKRRLSQDSAHDLRHLSPWGESRSISARKMSTAQQREKSRGTFKSELRVTMMANRKPTQTYLTRPTSAHAFVMNILL